MFKITLIKKEIFYEPNSKHYKSQQVTGRINKECIICARKIKPGEKSVTNTRKQILVRLGVNNKTYMTKHTCIGKCTQEFSSSKFIQ